MSEATPPVSGAPAPQTEPQKPVESIKKIELTEADLQARIDAALKAERDSAAKAKSDADAEAKKKADEEQGKWKELKEAAERDLATEKAERRKLTIATGLSSHLIDKHPDYAKSAKYILPLIPSDTKDADLPKAIETAAAEFVKDNPRHRAGGAGVPNTSRFTNGGGAEKPKYDISTADGYLRKTYTGPRLPNRN